MGPLQQLQSSRHEDDAAALQHLSAPLCGAIANSVGDEELTERNLLEFELWRALCTLHVVAFSEMFACEAFPVLPVSPSKPTSQHHRASPPRAPSLTPRAVMSPYATVAISPHHAQVRVFPHWHRATPPVNCDLQPITLSCHDDEQQHRMQTTDHGLRAVSVISDPANPLLNTNTSLGLTGQRFSSTSFETSVYSWPSEKFAFQRQTVKAVYRHCDSVVTDEAFSRMFIDSDEAWHRRILREQMLYGITTVYQWVLGGSVPVVREYVAVQQRWASEDVDHYGRHLPPMLRHWARAPQPPLAADGEFQRYHRLSVAPNHVPPRLAYDQQEDSMNHSVLPVLSVDFSKTPAGVPLPPHRRGSTTKPLLSGSLHEANKLPTMSPPKGVEYGNTNIHEGALLPTKTSTLSPPLRNADGERAMVLQKLQRGEQKFPRPNSGSPRNRLPRSIVF